MSKSMFEVYLNEVTDEALRARLKAEFERTTKKFGLVFERHSPEGIRMPQAQVRRGRTVIREADGTFHKVRAISSDLVTLADEHGNIIEEKLSNVTAARQFGEVVFPGLKTVGSVRTGNTDDPAHVVINGENFHALEMLGYTHPESVDLIYIDPPYNTGNKTWQYNDHYVGEQDSFRHSKWLSFMERRLTLAKRLLKPTGVIIVAIGDEEHHRLRMLMDEIFGSQNFLSNVVWQGGRKNDSRYVSNGADYMLIYANSEAAMTEAGRRWREEKAGFSKAVSKALELWEAHDHNGESATAEYVKWLRSRKGDFDDGVKRYSIIESDTGRLYSGDGNMVAPEARPNRSRRPLIHPITGKPCSVPPNGWRYSDEEMDRRVAADLVVFGADEKKIPRGKSYLDEMSTAVADSFFIQDRNRATGQLAKVLGDKRFPFPKDHEVLMRWLRMATTKDAVILDFFGGSGTTAEAVIRLNAEDQGTRQCILVTNNELSAKDDAALRKAGHGPGSPEYEAKGVFHHVTKPRIETVVTGERQDGSAYSSGLPANVEFLNLAYLEESHVHAALEYESLAPLFWLKSGAVGSVVQRTEETQDYEWNEASSMAVLFNAGKAAELAELLSTKPNQVHHVFIITDSPEQGDLAGEAFSDDITVEPIYGSYLDAFQINRSDS